MNKDAFIDSQYRRHPLDYIFKPQTVAVIGATEKEGSVGRTLLWNLISNPFGGTIYPVNPKRNNVLGIRAYPSVGEIPDKIDLAVIVHRRMCQVGRKGCDHHLGWLQRDWPRRRETGTTGARLCP